MALEFLEQVPHMDAIIIPISGEGGRVNVLRFSVLSRFCSFCAFFLLFLLRKCMIDVVFQCYRNFRYEFNIK